MWPILLFQFWDPGKLRQFRSNYHHLIFIIIHPSIHPSIQLLHVPLHSSHFSSLQSPPHPFLLVSVTPFQTLRLAAGLLGHVVHWLEVLATHSLLSHYLLSELGDSQDPEACAHMNTDTHTQRNIRNIQCENFRSLHPSHTDVPLGTLADCGEAAQGAF